jgi:cytochrome c551/c552
VRLVEQGSPFPCVCCHEIRFKIVHSSWLHVTQGLKPDRGRHCTARLKACPSERCSIRLAGKMPARQPAGCRRYPRLDKNFVHVRLVKQRSPLPCVCCHKIRPKIVYSSWLHVTSGAKAEIRGGIVRHA